MQIKIKASNVICSSVTGDNSICLKAIVQVREDEEIKFLLPISETWPKLKSEIVLNTKTVSKNEAHSFQPVGQTTV